MKKLLGASALALALGTTALVSSPAQAQAAPAAQQGTTSLAEVLAADGTKFDHNINDFDITEAAVLAVLKANPDSAVGLLADGNVRLTAFVPTDKAFRVLARDLWGMKTSNEKKLFTTVASLGIGTVEDILLYHVVPGKTLTSDVIKKSDGKEFQTGLDGLTVRVDKVPGVFLLHDRDDTDYDPGAKVFDINRGNKQVAIGINKVLRPVAF